MRSRCSTKTEIVTPKTVPRQVKLGKQAYRTKDGMPNRIVLRRPLLSGISTVCKLIDRTLFSGWSGPSLQWRLKHRNLSKCKWHEVDFNDILPQEPPLQAGFIFYRLTGLFLPWLFRSCSSLWLSNPSSFSCLAVAVKEKVKEALLSVTFVNFDPSLS